MRVSLDFTTPFEVGDKVFTSYPPETKTAVSGPAFPDHLPVTITTIKIVFDLAPDNGLVITQSTPEKVLSVEQLIYTLLPDPSSGMSAFMVKCAMGSDEPPKLFASEEECINSSLAQSL